MSRTFFPDVSSNQSGISFAGYDVACIKATEGDYYTNPDFHRAYDNAVKNSAFPVAYHFLVQDHTAPQAERLLSVIPEGTAIMVDVETQTQTGSKPDMHTLLDFISETRKRGGVVHDVYLPHWYWQEMGSPGLAVLEIQQCFLTSSNYTNFSNHGAGFDPYGGVTPLVWQFTDQAVVNGYHPVDMNGFHGTRHELKSLLTTGQFPGPVGASNPVGNLHLIHRGWTSLEFGWDAQAAATGYTVHVHASNGREVAHETILGTSYRAGFLHPNYKYTVKVRAHPGNSAEPDAHRTWRCK